MSMEYAARVILDRQGQPVTYQPCEGEARELTALVIDHGFGSTPSGWDSNFFEGQARYAELKIVFSDMTDAPGYRDAFVFNGFTYDVRAAYPVPKTGARKMWWIVRGVADQRGTFR